METLQTTLGSDKAQVCRELNCPFFLIKPGRFYAKAEKYECKLAVQVTSIRNGTKAMTKDQRRAETYAQKTQLNPINEDKCPNMEDFRKYS